MGHLRFVNFSVFSYDFAFKCRDFLGQLDSFIFKLADGLTAVALCLMKVTLQILNDEFQSRRAAVGQNCTDPDDLAATQVQEDVRVLAVLDFAGPSCSRRRRRS